MSGSINSLYGAVGGNSYATWAINCRLAAYSTPFTLEMYVYPININSGSLFNVGADDGGSGVGRMQFGIDNVTGKLYYNYAGYPNVLMTSASVVLNKWNYLTWVSNGTTMTAYLNGVAGTPFTISSTSTSQYSVGGDDGGIWFPVGSNDVPSGATCIEADITNVRYTNGTALYNSNFYPPLSPLTALSNTQFLLLSNTSPTYLFNSASNNIQYTNQTNLNFSSLSPFNAASLMWVGI